MTTRFPRPLLYFFYRLLQLRLSSRGNDGTPFLDCSAVVGVSVGVNVVTLSQMIRRAYDVNLFWLIDGLPRKEGRAVLLALVLVLFAVIYCYVTAPRQLQIMAEIYDHESARSRRRGSMLCVAYVVASIGAFLTVALFLSP